MKINFLIEKQSKAEAKTIAELLKNKQYGVFRCIDIAAPTATLIIANYSCYQNTPACIINHQHLIFDYRDGGGWDTFKYIKTNDSITISN